MDKDNHYGKSLKLGKDNPVVKLAQINLIKKQREQFLSIFFGKGD